MKVLAGLIAIGMLATAGLDAVYLYLGMEITAETTRFSLMVLEVNVGFALWLLATQK